MNTIKIIHIAVMFNEGEVSVAYGKTREESVEVLWEDLGFDDDVLQGETKLNYLHVYALEDGESLFHTQALFMSQIIFNTLNTWEGWNDG